MCAIHGRTAHDTVLGGSALRSTTNTPIIVAPASIVKQNLKLDERITGCERWRITNCTQKEKKKKRRRKKKNRRLKLGNSKKQTGKEGGGKRGERGGDDGGMHTQATTAMMRMESAANA
jgi:hypothetical protein